MKIEKLITKYYTNTYFVVTNTAVAVVDPGGGAENIVAVLEQHGDKAVALLLTHGHFDHALSVAELVARGAKAYMSPKDDCMIRGGGHVFYRGITTPEFDYIPINDGDVLDIGGTECKVLATPGHSPGSVCYIFDDCIFSGDTLFCETVGRTDLPGSDDDAMRESIKKLVALKGDYVVYPGHGRQTTLNEERRNNPFLQGL
ncbi:MAG: MBL fold metallo-hydrolase [Firmicutes bacterium]|nr:MBL fold metallo-hydrolase [Bacillota bacterium]